MKQSNPRLSRLAMLVTAASTLVALVIGLKRISPSPVEKTVPLSNTPTSGADTNLPAAQSTALRKPTAASPGIPLVWRWLIFIGVLVISIVLLTNRSTGISTAIFALLIGASLAIAYMRGAGILRLTYNQLAPPAWIVRYQEALSRGMTVLAVVLLSISAYLLRTEGYPDYLIQTVLLVLVGGIVLGLAIRLRPSPRDVPHLRQPTDTTVKAQRFTVRWRLFVPGVLGIWLFSEMSGRAFNIGFLNTANPHIQFALLCISTGLVIWGVADGGFHFNWRRFLREDGLLLVGIVVVGFFLRFWGLDWTVRTLVDEIHYTTATAEFWQRNDIGLMRPMTGLIPFPWVYTYWEMFPVDLFKHTLTGLRAASSGLGTMNILALYLLARALFDRKTALLSAVLLMAFPPHIHFSRLALPHIADPLFATIGFAFIGRGLKYNRRVDYAVGGAGIAFSQYFYEAGRLFFPPLTIAWLIAVIFFGWKRLRPHWRGLLTMVLVFLVLTIPVYYTLAAMQYPLTPRYGDSGLDAAYWESLVANSEDDEVPHRSIDVQIDRLEAPWLFYVHNPEPNSVYYGGTEPLVIGVVIPLFLLGVFHALWRIRAPGMLLVVGWLLATSLGNSLLVSPAVAARYVVVFPALVLLIALGIRYTVPLLWPSKVTIVQAVSRFVLVGGLIAAVAVVQVAYYFGPHLEAYQVQSRPFYDIHDVVLRSLDFPPCTHLYVVTDEEDNWVGYGREMLTYFDDKLEDEKLRMDDLRLRDLTPEFFENMEKGIDYAFFVEPGNTDTPRLLRERFVVDGPFPSPYPMPLNRQYFLYYVSHEKNPDTLGLPSDTCSG